MLLEHQIHHAECRGHPKIPEQIVPLHGRSARHALVRNRHTRTTAKFLCGGQWFHRNPLLQPSGNPSRKWAVQARYGSQWATRILLPGSQTRVTLPKSFLGDARSVAVRGVSAYGAQGPAAAARR